MRISLILSHPNGRRRVPLGAIGLVVLLGQLLEACTGAVGGSGEPRVTVVASFYPIAEAARRVGGDRVRVIDLTPAGAEPHDLELSPDRMEEIAGADVVLYLGGGFQPGVEEAATSVAEGRVVDVLDGLPTMVEGSGEAVDTHEWLDPALMLKISERVERTLADADPGSHDGYEVRGEEYAGELADLDEELAAGLADCQSRAMVTSHAAFGYLAAAYGLEQRAVSGVSPEAEPDPARLAEIAAEVERDGTTTIFTEPLVSPELAETIARETGTTTAVLNPIEALTSEQADSGANYASLMRENLEALRAGLGCA